MVAEAMSLALQRADDIEIVARARSVATALTEGRSLEEIANERGVTMATARTHLKRIFAKTTTKRQGELVAMLLRGPLGDDFAEA